jgi:hypothetical protein
MFLKPALEGVVEKNLEAVWKAFSIPGDCHLNPTLPEPFRALELDVVGVSDRLILRDRWSSK